MKNYDILLERVSATLRPGGKLFVHIFVHLGSQTERGRASKQETEKDRVCVQLPHPV